MSSLKRKASNLPANDAKKAKQQGTLTSFFTPPKATTNGSKPSTSAAAAPASNFDKAKWLAKLTDEQKQLLKLEIDTLHDSWLALLKDVITTPEFLELKRFLDRETKAGKKVFPPKEDIYSWSRHTPFHTVKVVILGQDPYHNHNQAHGLAFSVRPPTPAPPSLKNMYTALKNDYPTFAPPPRNAGLLTPWADRGVLMLNTCLTVRAHEAKSHADRGWERFTQKVIDLVATKRTRGVVFLAWGTPAGKCVQKIDATRHLVLKSVHPSPLSAMRGFFDCGHFRKSNEWLIKRYGPDGEIDWSLSPESTTLSKAKKAAPAPAPAPAETDEDEFLKKLIEEAEEEEEAAAAAADEEESKKENTQPEDEEDED